MGGWKPIVKMRRANIWGTKEGNKQEKEIHGRKEDRLATKGKKRRHDFLTEHFTISQPRNPSLEASKLHRTCQTADCEALKLWNVRSGSFVIPYLSVHACMWWIQGEGKTRGENGKQQSSKDTLVFSLSLCLSTTLLQASLGGGERRPRNSFCFKTVIYLALLSS